MRNLRTDLPEELTAVRSLLHFAGRVLRYSRRSIPLHSTPQRLIPAAYIKQLALQSLTALIDLLQ